MNELGRLLTEGIKGMHARRHNTSILHVYEDLAERCARAVHRESLTSDAIRKWIAKNQISRTYRTEYTEVLARAFVKEGGMDQRRLRSFLHHAQYFEADRLVHELFPDTSEHTPPSSVQLYHNLPQPNYGKFIGRTAEQRELHRLLKPYPESIHHIITICGVGGQGKTALAQEVAMYYRLHYDHLRAAERFDAIIWFSAKETYLTLDGVQDRPAARKTFGQLYADIMTTFHKEVFPKASPAEQETAIRHVLQQCRTLLIIDNLETIKDAHLLAFLREPPAPTKIIVTTRHWIDVSYSYKLYGMVWEDARELVAQECAEKEVHLYDDQATLLYQRTSGVPLAIVWSIGQIGSGYSVDTVLRRLEEPGDDIARFCFEDAVARIRDTEAYKLLMALTFFAGDALRDELGWVARVDRDIGLRDAELVRLEKLSLVHRNRETDHYSMLPLTRQYALAELSKHPDFDEHTFSRWIQVALERSAAKVYDVEGAEGFSHAIQLISEAQQRIWLLNAAAQEESLEQSMKWIQQGGIDLTTAGEPAERLQTRVREFRRLIQQNHYYNQLIEQARGLSGDFEYLRIVQYPSGTITRDNTDYHYLQHLHKMVKASVETQERGVLISVRLYETKPNRNKTFAIIDRRYILIQENEAIEGCIRMAKLRVIDGPSPEILQTFETIYEEVLRKSIRASAWEIARLRDELPVLSNILHQPIIDLLTELVQQGTPDGDAVAASLITAMFTLGDDDIHRTLITVLHVLHQDAAIGASFQRIVAQIEQHNRAFTTWYHAQHSTEQHTNDKEDRAA